MVGYREAVRGVAAPEGEAGQSGGGDGLVRGGGSVCAVRCWLSFVRGLQRLTGASSRSVIASNAYTKEERGPALGWVRKGASVEETFEGDLDTFVPPA